MQVAQESLGQALDDALQKLHSTGTLLDTCNAPPANIPVASTTTEADYGDKMASTLGSSSHDITQEPHAEPHDSHTQTSASASANGCGASGEVVPADALVDGLAREVDSRVANGVSERAHSQAESKHACIEANGSASAATKERPADAELGQGIQTIAGEHRSVPIPVSKPSCAHEAQETGGSLYEWQQVCRSDTCVPLIALDATDS